MTYRPAFTLSRRSVIAGTAALWAAACSGRSGAPSGLLRVAIDSEADSLDPLKGQFASAALLYKQLHAPLTEYSPSGGLAPGLAASWRSSDARTWTFRLTPGLIDGRAVRELEPKGKAAKETRALWREIVEAMQ